MFSGMNTLVHAMYNQYLSHTIDTGKSMTLGMINYYTVSLAWLRMISIKLVNGDFITPTERDIMDIVQDVSFTLPKPLAVYLKSVGNLITPQKQHLYPHFPQFSVHGGHSNW